MSKGVRSLSPTLETTIAYVAVRRAIDESLGLRVKPPHYYIAELGLDERTVYRRLGQIIGTGLVDVKGFDNITVSVTLQISTRYLDSIKKHAKTLNVRVNIINIDDEKRKAKVELTGVCGNVLRVLVRTPYVYTYFDAPVQKCLNKIDKRDIKWYIIRKGLEKLSEIFDKRFSDWEEFRQYVSNEVKYARRGLVTIIHLIDDRMSNLILNTMDSQVRIKSSEEIIAGISAVELLREKLPVPAVVLVMDEDPVIERMRSYKFPDGSLWRKLNQLVAPPLVSAGRDYFIKTILYRYAVDDTLQLSKLREYIPLRVFRVLPRTDLLRRLRGYEKAGEVRIIEASDGGEVQVIAKEPPEVMLYPSSPLAVEKAVNTSLYISISHRVLGLTRIKYGKDAGGGVSGTIALVYDTIARYPLPYEVLTAGRNIEDWVKDIKSIALESSLAKVAEDSKRAKAVYAVLRKIDGLINAMIKTGMLIMVDVKGEDKLVASRSIVPTTLAAQYERNNKLAKEVIGALLYLKYRRGVEASEEDIRSMLERLNLPPNEILRYLLEYGLVYRVGERKYLLASDYRSALIDYMEQGLGLPTTLRLANMVAAYVDRLYSRYEDAKQLVVELLSSLVEMKKYIVDEPRNALKLLPMIQMLKAEALIETEPNDIREAMLEGRIVVKPYSGRDVENYKSTIQALWHSVAIGLGLDIKTDIDYTNDRMAREVLKELKDIAWQIVETKAKTKTR